MKKRVLSLVLALVMLLGLLPTAAFAGAREDGAAMAAVEEGALLNDALSQPGEELPELPELPVIQPATAPAKSMIFLLIPPAVIRFPASTKKGTARRGKESIPASIFCGTMISSIFP